MTIERRLRVATIVLTVFALGSIFTLFWSSRQVGRGIARIGGTAEIVHAAFMMQVLVDDYIDHGNRRALSQWEKYNNSLGQILNNETISESMDQALLASLRNSYQAVNHLYPRVREMKSSTESGDQSQDLKEKEMLTSLMHLQLEKLVNGADDLSKATQSLTLKRRNFVQQLIVALGVATVVIILTNIYLIRKSFIQPLKILANGADRVGAGDFDYIAEIKSDDEVGKLTQAFNTMVERLEKRTRELGKARDELERRVEERTAELGLANEQLVREIEERKRAEESVTAERQRLYDVLETLPVYVCLLDSDYRMPFANRYFRETFGESRGRRCHDFLFDRTEPCETCETYTVMKTRAPHHWYWTGPNRKDYDIYDFPFIDKDGSFLILEMGIDITERNKAEATLKQTLADLTRSNADLEQFAYVASHDLQEPLRNVASCMQMLEKGYKAKLGPDADQLMHYAVDSVARMKALIQDLLAYSRISTKGNPPGETDSEMIFEQTLSNLRSAIRETGAVVTHDVLPVVMADPAQLCQVFQNLIGNAVKFRRQQPPHVHVSAVKDGSKWVFSVRDNGIGVESRHLERIFVIFQRLNKRSQYGGTGMGLAIVKKIVERHRGRIWVESEPGKGTTFYFTIPAKEGTT